MARIILIVALVGAIFGAYYLFPLWQKDDPYLRIIVAHRLVTAARASIVAKSAHWREPYRTELLNAFSTDNITKMTRENLQSFIKRKDAEKLADFLESPVGQKVVRNAYGEYDLRNLSMSEDKKIAAFEGTSAYKAYMRYSEQGIKKYHDMIRARTKAVMRHISAENSRPDPFSVTRSKTDFERKKERLFQMGKKACLEEMTSYTNAERKKYCACADKIFRSNVTEAQLRDYFSAKITFAALMAPLRKKFTVCEP